jgi:hypothetical protein
MSIDGDRVNDLIREGKMLQLNSKIFFMLKHGRYIVCKIYYNIT